ncbi:DUF4167 domain-containing protein [Candidatus Rhodobacter oscarellae]|uniref:DUF4167 domain-containing protein n=1 Tax=Candidatus Rhodobacter oscarellae TaxID=1675527 RepID=UPI000670A404|nr:DUF4167 domain-containing protein [Candidatus Rhodobacter lobularis]
MRSSKQRSRSKQNRNRSVGNVVNRVFDSSGPEGKVRGTPQQIIDKYNQLARDAQLSGDRVATENFQQHAEHYTRMLAEATREQEARREAQEAQHRERQQQRNQDRNDQRGNQQQGGGGGGQPQPDSAPQPAMGGGQPDPGSAPQPDAAPQPDLASVPQPVLDVVDGPDVDAGADTGLVETPESKPAPKPRTRRPRKKPAEAAPAPAPATEPAPAPTSDDSGPAEAAE